MKILIIANYVPNKGGISGVVHNHYLKLKEENFNVEIFSTKRSTVSRLLMLNVLLRKVANSEIIHIHGCSYGGFLPIILGVLASKIVTFKKVIITYHGGAAHNFLSKNALWVRWFLKKADQVTVMSSFLQLTFTKFGIETEVLRNLLLFEPLPFIEKRYDKARIISIRSLAPLYNIDNIIKSFETVQGNQKNAILTIAGAGSEEKKLVNLASSIPNITFVGLLKNEKIPQLFASHNIFISVPSYDNQPMSILEAFSAGLLVISSNVGGIPDIITDGVNGLLVNPGSIDEISEKVEWVLNNPIKANAIAKKGTETLSDYTWENIGPTLKNLYGLR